MSYRPRWQRRQALRRNSWIGTKTAAANIRTGAAVMAGAGTMSATAQVTHNAALAASGVGTVAATARVTHNASCAASGVGTMAATARVTHNASCAAAGVGTMSATAQVTHRAAVAVAGVGTMLATGRVTHNAAVAFNGVGTMLAAGETGGHVTGSVAFSGAGTMAATARVTHNAAVVFVGVGTMSAAGTSTGPVLGSVSFVGRATMEATGTTSLLAYVFRTPARIREAISLSHPLWGRIKNTVSICLVQDKNGEWKEYQTLPPMLDGNAENFFGPKGFSPTATVEEMGFTGSDRIYRGGHVYYVTGVFQDELDAAATAEEPSGYSAYFSGPVTVDPSVVGDELTRSR